MELIWPTKHERMILFQLIVVASLLIAKSYGNSDLDKIENVANKITNHTVIQFPIPIQPESIAPIIVPAINNVTSLTTEKTIPKLITVDDAAGNYATEQLNELPREHENTFAAIEHDSINTTTTVAPRILSSSPQKHTIPNNDVGNLITNSNERLNVSQNVHEIIAAGAAPDEVVTTTNNRSSEKVVAPPIVTTTEAMDFHFDLNK